MIAIGLFFTPLGDKPLSIIFPVGKIQQTNFSTLKLTSKPNQYLLCPENYCAAKTNTTSPLFDLSIKELQKVWAEMMSAQQNVHPLPNINDINQIDYVQRTKLMRYPDIITVSFIEQPENKSTLAIYSRSIYGGSDFGANKKRIEQWMKKLLVLSKQ
ncbi:MAG: DUF1499 domain-containing protein [Sneathiella sp.]|nr:DUF1499 domain-containing protein [Sneathiella sp.]